MTRPASSASAAWRCTVCGYVHRAAQAPDFCPVCGAAAADFEAFARQEPAHAAPAKRWHCLLCGYVHDGGSPPESCPVCGAAADRFEPAPQAQAPPSAGPGPVRALILGAGIAGVSAAESLREASPDSDIVLLSHESVAPYYRLNLTRYIAGEIGGDVLPMHPDAWYAERRITLRTGAQVTALALAERSVSLADGTSLPFDRLILAAGSHPFLPPVPGAQLPGVFTLRTTADADALLDRLRGGGGCVCIGGGVLGIETAAALARRGVAVTLLESHEWLMPRQLNRRAGAILAGHLARAGVALRTNARTRQVIGRDSAAGVLLEDAAVLPAAAVVFATGVRPNTHLARKAGIGVNQGILVDDRLRTSAPDVFAAGDAAEHNGILYGLWSASQYQGAIAGMNAAGADVRFGGLPRSNSLKVMDIDLFSIGQFEPPDGSFTVVQDATDRTIRHFVFRDGRLAGAILIGHAGLSAALKKAVESGRDFTDLLGRSPTAEDVTQALALSVSS